MDDQVQNLVNKAWGKFLETPPERRLSESIAGASLVLCRDRGPWQGKPQRYESSIFKVSWNGTEKENENVHRKERFHTYHPLPPPGCAQVSM